MLFVICYSHLNSEYDHNPFKKNKMSNLNGK